jgi:hypothetical protein
MTANPSSAVARLSTQIPLAPEHVDSGELLLNILFTTPAMTVVALKRASALAGPVGATIRILVPHVVPYPRPLHEPDVNPAIKIEPFQDIRLPYAIPIYIQVLLCRNPIDAVMRTLAPNSLVLAGGRERRWPSRKKRLITRLRKAGHHVLLVDER